MKRADRIKRYFSTVVLVCLLTTIRLSAQNGINTPYSRYGLGVLTDGSTASSKAMGGIGTGIAAGLPHKCIHSIHERKPVPPGSVKVMKPGTVGRDLVDH